MKKCPMCFEEIQDDAIKCKHCGEMLNLASPSAGTQKKFYLSTRDKMISGVCGGLAEHLGMDATVVRLLFVLVTLMSAGILGVIAYFVMAAVVPPNPGE